MERQEVTAVLILDLLAAFNTVNHDLLLEVLNKRFGIKEKALRWYEQNLKPRKFKISINNTYSEEQTSIIVCHRNQFWEHFCSMHMPQQYQKSYHQHWNSMAMVMTIQLGNHLNQETSKATLNMTPLQS